MFKTQVEQQASGFTASFENFMASFLFVVDLFFTITFIFLRKPMLRHFHGLFTHRP